MNHQLRSRSLLACHLTGLLAAVPLLEPLTAAQPAKDLQRADFNLSLQGWWRSIALARWMPACFAIPSRIITFYLDPISSRHARSYQTAVPLTVATRVNSRIDMASLLGSFAAGEQFRAHRTPEGSRSLVRCLLIPVARAGSMV